MKSIEGLIRKRQSTRKFSDKPIAKEHILKCIEAARLAPSASNAQPWKFIVVDTAEKRARIAKYTYEKIGFFNKFTSRAQCFVVITLEKQKLITRLGKRIKGIDWELIDIGIAAQHLCLQAEELGIGSCMIGWYSEKPVKELLQIPHNKKVALIIALGYPVEGYKIRKKIRKPLKEVLNYNTY